MAETTASARLLFVLSSDFGELLNAMYFTAGQEFTTKIIMPGNLFSRNRDNLHVQSSEYESTADIIQAVERERPDIVFLFSGYLFGVNRIFDAKSMHALVDELRMRQCRVVTSDPFLGLMAGLDDMTFSDRHPQKVWLTTHFRRVSEVMRDIIHLYVVRPERFGSKSSLSFFNEKIVFEKNDLAQIRGRLSARPGFESARKQWLFVLSLEDYGAQANRLGRAQFQAIIEQKLREASAQGRQPVLIGPEPLITSLQRSASSLDTSLMIPFCQYDLFVDLLLDAEFVFYWNVFSSSIPLRLLNGMPFFFFDTGHMAQAIPPVFELGMRVYYESSSLIFLKQTATLDYEALAKQAKRDDEHGRAVARAHFRQSPSPASVVRIILNGEL